jgi:hypothetical protein
MHYAFVWGSLCWGLITGTVTLFFQKFLLGYPPVNIKYIIISYLIYMVGGFYWGYCIYPHQKRKKERKIIGKL